MSLPLLPARMLNEYTYCPRLFVLEWVHGEWAPSADTVDGDRVHRRVDRPDSMDLDGQERRLRSLDLASEALGLVARADVVDARTDEVVPIDFKRGSPPANAEGAWEPERVQLCAQGLLLREGGSVCKRGFLWFAEARRRVEVVFDDELVSRTLQLVAEARALAESGSLPPPLEDSPKCPRCSLVGICLPDETNLLRGVTERVRPIVPARDDAVGVHVQRHRGKVGRSGGELVVREGSKEVGRARLAETSSLAIYGNVSVTTPLLADLADRGIPVSFHSYGGWFRGIFHGSGGHGVHARIAQHRVAASADGPVKLARRFIEGKIRNSRVFLLRNKREDLTAQVKELKRLTASVRGAETLGTLLGLEGLAARVYFGALPRLFQSDLSFDLTARNRRPPRDPVNALLSFAYSFLARECTSAVMRVGLDPSVGFLHQPRPGRPALALDLMEEFRPVLADSAVIRAINNGEVSPNDFVVRARGCSLTQSGRGAFIKSLERRFGEEVTHPLFGTRLSYRRVLEVQARLLSRVLLGELTEYPAFTVR